MSRYGYDSDRSQGRRDFERGSGRYSYDSQRYNGYGEGDRDYREGFDSARREQERRDERRAEEQAETDRQERAAAARRQAAREDEERQEAERDEQLRLEQEQAEQTEPPKPEPNMKELIDYIIKYAERGPCQCGKCSDAVPNPETKQPAGHTADLVFFKVSAKPGADAETLRRLVRENKDGACGDVDLFDGKEHGYFELGGWIGDQGLAMMLMGLGDVLGLWTLLTPSNLPISDELKRTMAGTGMLSIIAKPT